MTNRRVFLGGTLAVAAAGLCGIAARGPSQPETMAFYPLDPGGSQPGGGGVLLGHPAGFAGEPIAVERRAVEVGHFHGLSHEGDGRIVCLYEATIAGPSPKRGLVKLDGTMAATLI